jgi:hypothetical protein
MAERVANRKPGDAPVGEPATAAVRRYRSSRAAAAPRAAKPEALDANRSAVTLTVIIVAIMTMAIAIDASSAPGLSVFAILVLGSVIAAIAYWG